MGGQGRGGSSGGVPPPTPRRGDGPGTKAAGRPRAAALGQVRPVSSPNTDSYLRTGHELTFEGYRVGPFWEGRVHICGVWERTFLMTFGSDLSAHHAAHHALPFELKRGFCGSR